MTRLSFTVREGLADHVASRVLGADFERASEVFYAALDKVRESAGLNYEQYSELESAANGAMYDLADVTAGELVALEEQGLVVELTTGRPIIPVFPLDRQGATL